MENENMLQSGFTIGTDEHGYKYIRCFGCGKKSYTKGDINHKYCACCNKFHNPQLEFSPVVQNKNKDKETISVSVLDYKFLVSQNIELLKQNRELQRFYRGKSRSVNIFDALGMATLYHYCGKKEVIDEKS